MTAPAPAPDTSATDGTTDEPATDLAAELAKWKKLSRENESKAKANAAAAQRLEQIEADQKAASQSAADKTAEAEARASAADLRALRLEVAFDKGLTPAQAKRLVGASREDLESDADEVLRDFPVKPVSTAPKPDPSQGVHSGGPVSGRDQGLAEAQRRFGAPKQ